MIRQHDSLQVEDGALRGVTGDEQGKAPHFSKRKCGVWKTIKAFLSTKLVNLLILIYL